MLAIVIPARNEAARIQTVLRQALRLPAALVIPVVNGCDDMTEEIVRRTSDKRLRAVYYRDALGFDVPRIAGAQAALDAGALAVLFVDADLGGRIEQNLQDLVDRIRRGTDLALSDCYVNTPVPIRNSAARDVFEARLALNQTLGRRHLGAAIPSHGPVAVSRKLLQTVPMNAVGVPPLMQAHACLAGLRVEVGTAIPHKQLGSVQRDQEHRLKIAETIIGDCLQAICVAEGRPPDREGYIGYHRQRRFNLVGLQPPPEGGAPESVERSAEGDPVTAGELRED